MKIHRTLPPKTDFNSAVAIDIEITGAERTKLHLPITGKFASLQIATDEENVYYIDDVSMVDEALERVNESIWVMQKGQFDIAHLRKWATTPDRFTGFWDTLYIEKILWGGYFHGFSLADMARRYFNIVLDKDIRKEYSDAEEITPEMIHYACYDAIVTLMVYQKQKEILSSDEETEVWIKTDLPPLWGFLASKPFRIDVDGWNNLADRNQIRADEIISELEQYFNPRSPIQVKKWLNDNGMPGIPGTDARKVLPTWIAKHPDTHAAKIAEKVIYARKLAKRVDTYGKGFFDNYLFQESDDVFVVKPDYYVTQAETGRTSASDPPIQGIPVRDTTEFREQFIPRPGNILIIADYSKQEPGLAAYYSQDPKFIDAYNNGEDLYISIAEFMYNEKITKDDPRRNKAKDLTLGMIYGQTCYGIANNWGISTDEAQRVIDHFFSLFPKLKEYLDFLSSQVQYVRTITGRKIWLNEYSYQRDNNAKNGPHQGGAADMMKRAVGSMYKSWDYDRWGDWALVQQVHDEVGFDVPIEISSDVAEFVRYHMVSVAEDLAPGINWKVDVKLAENWAEGK